MWIQSSTCTPPNWKPLEIYLLYATGSLHLDFYWKLRREPTRRTRPRATGIECQPNRNMHFHREWRVESWMHVASADWLLTHDARHCITNNRVAIQRLEFKVKLSLLFLWHDISFLLRFYFSSFHFYFVDVAHRTLDAMTSRNLCCSSQRTRMQQQMRETNCYFLFPTPKIKHIWILRIAYYLAEWASEA